MRNIKKKELSSREIDVYVSFTISKPMKLKVNDYEVTKYWVDNDNLYHEIINYSNCNLKENLISQGIHEQFNDWNIDDFEVILEKNDHINKSHLD